MSSNKENSENSGISYISSNWEDKPAMRLNQMNLDVEVLEMFVFPLGKDATSDPLEYLQLNHRMTHRGESESGGRTTRVVVDVFDWINESGNHGLVTATRREFGLYWLWRFPRFDASYPKYRLLEAYSGNAFNNLDYATDTAIRHIDRYGSVPIVVIQGTDAPMTRIHFDSAHGTLVGYQDNRPDESEEDNPGTALLNGKSSYYRRSKKDVLFKAVFTIPDAFAEGGKTVVMIDNLEIDHFEYRDNPYSTHRTGA